MRAWLRRRRNATGTPAVFEAAAGCPRQSGRAGCRFLPALKIASVSVYTSYYGCGTHSLLLRAIRHPSGAGTAEIAVQRVPAALELGTPSLAVAQAARDTGEAAVQILASRAPPHQTTYDKNSSARARVRARHQHQINGRADPRRHRPEAWSIPAPGARATLC